MEIIQPNYSYTGWEISWDGLICLQKKLIENRLTKLDIIEFGSGKSTEVLLSFKEKNNLPGVFNSFDCNPEFSHPISKIRNIISFDNTRPVIPFGDDYSFYDLKEEDFSSENYDLVVLDGNHGH
jgi:hypothetical protein